MTQPDRPPRDSGWDALGELPPEFIAFGSPVDGGLPVGAAGKLGVLELALASRNGITRVQRHYQRAPLHIYRPIYLDPCLPGMAFVFLQQSGDGLVQGDRYRIDIDCAERSAVHVTTQTATKVFTARRNFVTQMTNLRAHAGAVLEYLPDPVIPFRGSRLFQRTCVTAHPESTVILSDTLLPGRVAHGEAHDYDLYWAETEVRRPDGTLLFTDLVRFQPDVAGHPKSIGLLGSYEVLATLYIVSGRRNPADMVSVLRASVSGRADLLAGVSELPNGAGTAVRLLGTGSKQVQAALRAAWNAARLELLGAPAPDLRKG